MAFHQLHCDGGCLGHDVEVSCLVHHVLIKLQIVTVNLLKRTHTIVCELIKDPKLDLLPMSSCFYSRDASMKE